MRILILLLTITVFMASCAPGPNPEQNTANPEGKVAGFWLGLWHGFIFPFTFIISLFKSSVHVYETHNNGNWYNFGYLAGLIIMFGQSRHVRKKD